MKYLGSGFGMHHLALFTMPLLSRTQPKDSVIIARQTGLAALYGALLCLALPLHPGIFLGLLGTSALLLLTQPPVAGTRNLAAISVWPAFVLVSMISALSASDWQRAMLVSVSMAPALVLGFLLATRLTVSNLQQVGFVLALTGTLLALNLLRIALGHTDANPPVWLERAGYSHLSVPNDLLILVFSLVFTINLLYFHQRSSIQLLSAVSCAVQFSALTIYQSRGGIVLATTAVIVLSASRGYRRLPLILGAAVLMFFLADTFSGFALMEKLLTTSTLSARIPLWMAAWSMFLDAPWLGQGPGAFSVLYPQYLTTLTLPDWVVIDPRHMPWTHNLYLELLAERGSIGFATFLTAVALTLRPLLGHRAQRGRSTAAHVQTTTLVCGALLLTGGLFEFSLLRLWLLVLIAVIAGFALVLQNQSE